MESRAGAQEPHPILLRRPVGSSMRLFYRKPVITSRTSLSSSLCAPHIYDQFMAFTDNTDLAILLNKDTFEPDPIVLTYKVDSTSKGSWGMVLLIVRGLLRRPSLTGSPTVTFCSVHINNVVAKKRDASTDLLQRLHGYMREHNVDFIGGDFNMSAFSTVGDVITDDEFSAPGNSLLWGLGALEEPNRECAGFLIMPKRPYEWRVHSHGCYKFDNALLGLGPRDQSAHLPVFLHLRNTNLPGPSSIMRSDQAQQRRLERRHDEERSTRTPLSPFRENSTRKNMWVWSYSSFEHCCAAPHFLEHRLLHFAQYTFTMSWPKNVMHPLSFFTGFMDICGSTMSTSLGATLT